MKLKVGVRITRDGVGCPEGPKATPFSNWSHHAQRGRQLRPEDLTRRERIG